MRDNMKNFREASNTILKDIYVTDELKRKTLEKCTNKRFSKLSPLLVSTASAAVLIVTFGVYNYFSYKPPIANNYINNSIKHEYKNSVNNKAPQSPSKIAENKNLDNSKYSALNNENNIKNENSTLKDKSSDTSTVTKNTDIASQNTNNTTKPSDNISLNGIDNNQSNSKLQNKSSDTSIITKNTDITSQNTNITTKSPDNISLDEMDINQDKDIYVSAKAPADLTSSEESLNMLSAEKYFGSKILLPNNIPEEFNLTCISIPDYKLKCIKLNYSSNSTYFEILQNKNLSKLEGTKIISIENNKAYISSIKDEKSNIVITKITWIMNNIEYSLSGNLPENSLINVAKSIK